MKAIHVLFAFATVFFLSCTKDGQIVPLPVPNPASNTPFACEDTSFDRTPFPKEPDFGWKVDPNYGKASVWRVIYDPIDENVFYYMTWEENTQPYTLWKYDRNMNMKIKLDDNLGGNIDVNKNGWLVYTKMDKNIYTIKTTGDSLKQLTHGSYLDATWSESGHFIYVYSDDVYHGGTFKVKATNGEVVDTLKNMPYTGAVHECKNYLYYFNLENNVRQLAQRNLTTNQNRIIVSNNNNLNADFSYFFTDENNTTLYWGGDVGFFKTDLASLQTTQVINFGRYTRNMIFAVKRSPINGRYVAIQDSLFLVNPTTLGEVFRIVEFTPDGLCRRKIFVP